MALALQAGPRLHLLVECFDVARHQVGRQATKKTAHSAQAEEQMIKKALLSDI